MGTIHLPGRLIARYRDAHGLTQKVVAESVRLQNPASVSALETGKDEPSFELAVRLEVFSDAELRAEDLRPDLAELIGAWRALHRRLIAAQPEGAAA